MRATTGPRRLISLDRDRTPRYSLGGFNCTDWVFKVADAAGVKLPSARALGTGLLDPEELANKYKAMWRDQGGRNIPGADAVFKNTANVWPNNVVDPPARTIDLDSYTDITLLAFTAPRTIAHALDMTARTAVLPAETVGVGRPLRISLKRLGTLPTVTEVQFGDGARQYQRRTFAHSYRRPGTYRLRGIAIANATVYRFSFQVRVVRGGGAVSAATTVPHHAPRHYHFAAAGAGRVAAAHLARGLIASLCREGAIHLSQVGSGSCRQLATTIRARTASCWHGSQTITRASTTWSGCAGRTDSAAHGASVVPAGD